MAEIVHYEDMLDYLMPPMMFTAVLDRSIHPDMRVYELTPSNHCVDYDYDYDD